MLQKTKRFGPHKHFQQVHNVGLGTEPVEREEGPPHEVTY